MGLLFISNWKVRKQSPLGVHILDKPEVMLISRMSHSSSLGDDVAIVWEELANDVELDIDANHATGAGELLMEFPMGKRIKMGGKVRLAEVRDPPIKIKCPALSSSAADELYLLAFIDPDAPSKEKPAQRYLN